MRVTGFQWSQVVRRLVGVVLVECLASVWFSGFVFVLAFVWCGGLGLLLSSYLAELLSSGGM